MNSCGYQQRSAMAVCEERMMMAMDSVVCPKPRRYAQIRPIRLPFNNPTEMGDSKAGAELLDIILTKGGYSGEKQSQQVASSPPFFCGSPPSRASNPLTQDAHFGNEGINLPPSPAPPSPSSASSLQGGGGCVRMKFGHKPAAVRIEGFDCLSRDRRNCSISAVA